MVFLIFSLRLLDYFAYVRYFCQFSMQHMTDAGVCPSASAIITSLC